VLCVLGMSFPAAWGADRDPGGTSPIASSASLAHRAPYLRSETALVVIRKTGEPLLVKNTDRVVPIASITKLMTGMVVIDSELPLNQAIDITKADVDRLKVSHSRLGIGTTLTRGEMLKLALMASENRAAAALARTYPGGKPAFVAAMNRKAAELGMEQTHFVDSTGLSPNNVSTADDLVRMVDAASHYRLIRLATTTKSMTVISKTKRQRRVLTYTSIGLSKTGYISEAGRCLVMEATIVGHKTIIVLLGSWGKLSRIGDANRIRHWIEHSVATTASR
jgi:D-alanyl-D-alanine endopeptidase (penicillin-binding protein 7)